MRKITMFLQQEMYNQIVGICNREAVQNQLEDIISAITYNQQVENISEAAEAFQKAKQQGKKIGSFGPKEMMGRYRGRSTNPLYTAFRGKAKLSSSTEASLKAAQASEGLMPMSAIAPARKAQRESWYGYHAARTGNHLEAYQHHENSALKHLESADWHETKGRGMPLLKLWRARRHRRAALANIIAAEIHKKLVTFDAMRNTSPNEYEKLKSWGENIPQMGNWMDWTKKARKEYLLHEHKDTLSNMIHAAYDNPALLGKLRSGFGDKALREEREKQARSKLPLHIPVRDEKAFGTLASTAEGRRIGSVKASKEGRPYAPEVGQLVLFHNPEGRTIHIGRVGQVDNEGTHWGIHLNSKGRDSLTNEEKNIYDLGYRSRTPLQSDNPIHRQLHNAGRYDALKGNSHGHSLKG